MEIRTFFQTSILFSYLIFAIFLNTGCKEDSVPVVPPTQQHEGKSYYVSTAGNDNDSGTIQHPWRTIQRAANTLLAGDTVYVMEGTYNERVIPQNSGSSGNYIVYRTYQNGAVTIDGSGIALPNDLAGLFHISVKSYIRVSGFRIINAGPNSSNAGIFVTGSSYITLYGNSTYSTVSSGIGVWASNNITIDSNDVELACNNGEQECITVNGSNVFEVKNNFVHNGGPGTNGGEGIDAKDGSSNGRIYRNRITNIPARPGIYVDAWNKHTFSIDVYQNLIYNNGRTGILISSEQGGLLENVRVYNNVVYGNSQVGLMINSCCISQHPIQNVTIINNTFYGNGQGTWGGGILDENTQAQSVIIRNNICSQNLSFQIALEGGVQQSMLTTDHNLIDGFRGYTGEFYGRDSVVGDPGFVNPLSGDFHLLVNSIAIDRGSSVNAPSDDYDRTPRPQGLGFDIGAFEYRAPQNSQINLNGNWKIR